MKVPEWIKPLVWGVIGGGIAAMIIGFGWGGWVTGGTAQRMEAESVEAAIVQAVTPLCVSKGEQEPDQLVALEDESGWKRDQFVMDAGWVDNVKEKFRRPVAEQCASVLVEGMATPESSD